MSFDKIKENRAWSFVIIFIIYVLAGLGGYAVFNLFPLPYLILRLAAADIAATVVVWLFSVVFANSSVYDPYWSVAPPVILGLVIFGNQTASPLSLLFLGVIVIWSIRLTLNWAANFPNLTVQGWRYTQYKEKYPKIWLILNLFGIHLVPTAVVFVCLIPAIHRAAGNAPITLPVLAGAALCIFAICLETVSDWQMHRFRSNTENRGQVNREGVWKYSRHPNYLGEVLLWWGIWAMAFFSGPLPLYAFLGPIAVTLLFLLVSIPLMEKRQLAIKPAYREYMQATAMLLPRLRNPSAESQSQANV